MNHDERFERMIVLAVGATTRQEILGLWATQDALNAKVKELEGEVKRLKAELEARK